MSQVFARMSCRPPRLVVAPAGTRLPSAAVTGTLVLPRHESRKVAAAGADINVGPNKLVSRGRGSHVRALKFAGGGDRVPIQLVAEAGSANINGTDRGEGYADDSTSGEGKPKVDLMELVEQQTHRVLDALKELTLRHEESHDERRSREKHRARLRDDCRDLLLQMKRGDLTDQVAVSTLIGIQSELKVMIGSLMSKNMFGSEELNNTDEEKSPAVTLMLNVIRDIDVVFQTYDEYMKPKQYLEE